VKASESGLGATFGRTEGESIGKLARRIWLSILVRELNPQYKLVDRRRIESLTDFRVPMRRSLPISKPHVYISSGFMRYNRRRGYNDRIKPFGFLQAVIPALAFTKNSVQPIAPFERDLTKSKKLQWTDYRTARAVDLDWEGNFLAATVPVARFDEVIDLYRRHPESKAAGPDGRPADEETRGMLGRLRLTAGAPRRIGKEVDRLDEDDEFILERSDPAEYTSTRPTLKWALGVLADEPAAKIAPLLGMSERRFRDVRKGLVKTVRRAHVKSIVLLAQTRQRPEA
jgi:hypothetical protein